MRRVPAPTVLLAAAVLLTAAKRLPPGEELLQRSISSLGGASKYERLETLAYEFVEKRAGERGDVLVTGRHAVKLHDDRGLRVRTEARSPGGAMQVALVTSSGVWVWRGGVPVTAPEELEKVREEVLRGVFFLFLPHNIKEAGWPVRYAGMGYLQGKLSQRLEVVPPPASTPTGSPTSDQAGGGVAPSADSTPKASPHGDQAGGGVEPRPAGTLPAVGNFTVWLDSGTQWPSGLTFGPADEPEGLAVFISHYATERGLSLPLDRREASSDGKTTSSFAILNLAVNSYMDDALFDPARGPSPEMKN